MRFRESASRHLVAGILHLDVMDGHFVPNLSYGPMVIERMRELTDLPFDAHLMIAEPERYLDEFLNAGCDWVTFHIETVSDPKPLLRRIRESGAVAGLALNPETPVSSVLSILDECDLILVMSVEPGFGGQKFLPDVLDKVRQIADHRRNGTMISIDGGIGPSTITAAATTGPARQPRPASSTPAIRTMPSACSKRSTPRIRCRRYASAISL